MFLFFDFWIIQQKCIFSQFGRLEVQDQRVKVSSEASLLGLQMATYAVSSYVHPSVYVLELKCF